MNAVYSAKPSPERYSGRATPADAVPHGVLHSLLIPTALAIVALMAFYPRLCQALPANGTLDWSQEEIPGKKMGQPIQDVLRAGFALYYRDESAQATAKFREALSMAKKENDLDSAAEAHRGLGLVLYVQGQYVPARQELDDALAKFQAVSDFLGVARARQNLGMLFSVSKGDWKTARLLYRQAFEEYSRRHDVHDEASLLRDLDFDPSVEPQNQIKNIQRGLALLKTSHDERLEGDFLEDWGDALFVEGNYAQAIEKLEEAGRCFERTGDRFSLGRVLTSEGRIYRAHGLPSRALPLYERALQIQRQIGDAFGAAQSMNAMAVAYDLMGEPEKSLVEGQAALQVARQTGSSRLIAFSTGNVAGERLEMKQYALAVRGLKQALAQEKSPYLEAFRMSQLSEAEFGLGDYPSSISFASEALRLNSVVDRDLTLKTFYWRAKSEQRLGSVPEALADVNSSLQILEQIRGQLAPDDFMKRHFTDWSGFLYDFAVALNVQLGRDRDALAVAEAGRARALGDLLASRSLRPQIGQAQTIAATGALLARAEPASQDTVRAAVPLTLRGVAAGSSTGLRATTRGTEAAAPNLHSFASTQPLSVAQMVRAASRMRSTLLVYWTASDATYIWVVKADGSIGSARVDVSRRRLEALISELWPRPRLEPRHRGGVAALDERIELRLPSGSGAVVGRGGEELTFGPADKQNWRELYRLLIRPVAEYLPPAGSLLTIEPHGPLLLLPFAALINERGEYLIERFRMNYLPSLALFPYVEEQKEQAKRSKPYFLLVADPEGAPTGPQGERLPALPGARREVAEIARALPSQDVTLLVGRQAQEHRVDGYLPEATVIHFATHAILNSQRPSESYLALGAGGDFSGGAGGRLTASRVYSLRLHANLVFLSACRTGMGRISGDGVVGLTRAFFYAGTASLIASLWDVSDETTVHLVPDFYRHWLAEDDKSQALREAQIHLLRELRAGRIKMRTPYGWYTLPEDPILWASFVLEGEP